MRKATGMRWRRTLLVFVKHPEPGQVKTRLARTVGQKRAALLYRQWIGSVLGRLQPLRTTTRLVGYFGGAPQEAFPEVAPPRGRLVGAAGRRPGGPPHCRFRCGV
jgi:hypothetical protein